MTNIVFEKYQSLYKLTEEMLELAEKGEWDTFINFESDFENLSHSLPNLIDIEHSDFFMAQLLDILSKTVENINQINELSLSKQNKLNEDLSSLFQQKKIHKTYSEFSDEAIETRVLKDIFRE